MYWQATAIMKFLVVCALGAAMVRARNRLDALVNQLIGSSQTHWASVSDIWQGDIPLMHLPPLVSDRFPGLLESPWKRCACGRGGLCRWHAPLCSRASATESLGWQTINRACAERSCTGYIKHQEQHDHRQRSPEIQATTRLQPNYSQARKLISHWHDWRSSGHW